MATIAREIEEPRRILIVDDNPDVIGLFEAMLEEHYAIIKACGGEECLLMLEKERPDLVLLNIVMPDINGFAILERMKQKEELRSIPVIVHTAADLESEIRKRGIKNYIIKPVTKDELLSMVKKALQGK